jgi:hypothetical protein
MTRWRIALFSLTALLLVLTMGALVFERLTRCDLQRNPEPASGSGDQAPSQRPLSTIAHTAPLAPSSVMRVPLQRPSPVQYADAGLRPIAQQAAAMGVKDRRENPGPRAEQEMEIIHYAFDSLEEDVRSCLEQWEALEPGEARQVMIAFQIDADGLKDSWLEHDGGVPFGPRTCLSNAVYGLDWSKIVDHPAKLSTWFQLGRDDAGK